MRSFTFGIVLIVAFCISSLDAKGSAWNKETHLRPLLLNLCAETAPYIAALTCLMHDRQYPEEANGHPQSIVYDVFWLKVTLDAYRISNKAMDLLSDHLQRNHIY